MAYELKRSSKIEGVTIDGEEIPVVLDVYQGAKELNQRYLDLVHTRSELKKIQTKGAPGTEDAIEIFESAYESIGNAVISLLQLIFGDDGAQKIINFYDGKYEELLIEILPYIINVIIPHVRNASAENRKRFAAINTGKKRGFHKKFR